MFDAEKIANETIGALQSHVRHLLDQLYFGGVELQPMISPSGHWLTDPLVQSPLGENIKALVAYANGQEVADDFLIPEMIQSTCEALFGQAFTYSYHIPPHFWGSELGQVILLSQVRTRGDELLTLTEATVLLYGQQTDVNIRKIGRLIASGKLTGYLDPSEKNPRRQRRVSRQEVERLKQ
jgi:hypothetical protein